MSKKGSEIICKSGYCKNWASVGDFFAIISDGKSWSMKNVICKCCGRAAVKVTVFSTKKEGETVT